MHYIRVNVVVGNPVHGYKYFAVEHESQETARKIAFIRQHKRRPVDYNELVHSTFPITISPIDSGSASLILEIVQ